MKIDLSDSIRILDDGTIHIAQRPIDRDSDIGHREDGDILVGHMGDHGTVVVHDGYCGVVDEPMVRMAAYAVMQVPINRAYTFLDFPMSAPDHVVNALCIVLGRTEWNEDDYDDVINGREITLPVPRIDRRSRNRRKYG